MLKRAIIIFPQFENIEVLERIREKYDPLCHAIRPHISLVFPFESEISTEALREHVENALRGMKPFQLMMKDITGDHGGYLFLNVKKGNDDIIELHDRLYSGILSNYRYIGLTYCPHLTVGRLHDETEYKAALRSLYPFNQLFSTVVDQIFVEVIGESDQSNIEFKVVLK